MQKRLRVTVNGEEFEVTVEEMEDGESARTAPPVSRPQPRPVREPEPQAIPEEKTKEPEPAAEETPPAKEEPPKEEAPVADRGEIEVNAPLAGSIKSINVSVGDEVTEGETVLTLEALKLENEIVSPADGTVATIEVSTGDNVDGDQVLMTLNPA